LHYFHFAKWSLLAFNRSSNEVFIYRSYFCGAFNAVMLEKSGENIASEG
jgi:hypothetical protein